MWRRGHVTYVFRTISVLYPEHYGDSSIVHKVTGTVLYHVRANYEALQQGDTSKGSNSNAAERPAFWSASTVIRLFA